MVLANYDRGTVFLSSTFLTDASGHSARQEHWARPGRPWVVAMGSTTWSHASICIAWRDSLYVWEVLITDFSRTSLLSPWPQHWLNSWLQMIKRSSTYSDTMLSPRCSCTTPHTSSTLRHWEHWLTFHLSEQLSMCSGDWLLVLEALWTVHKPEIENTCRSEWSLISLHVIANRYWCILWIGICSCKQADARNLINVSEKWTNQFRGLFLAAVVVTDHASGVLFFAFPSGPGIALWIDMCWPGPDCVDWITGFLSAACARPESCQLIGWICYADRIRSCLL